MNAEVWRRAEELYHAALKLPASERAAFLSKATGNPQVLSEVESLLAHEGKADGLLESPTLDHLAIGQVISHYRISAKLGEGGMGVVWKAHDTELNRAVALKTLPAEAAHDISRRARFLSEARSASALNHPNIVTIHDIVHQDDATYLVMEFVDGKPLDRIIPKKGLKINDALKYGIQITSALAAAHKVGIIHRDLKPANVIVTPAGVVKVLDFGLAKLVEAAAIAPEDSTGRMQALTESGMIVGTLSYMSPEQAEGKTVDARSDIFSFGSLLHEMISGECPFQRKSRISTLSAIVHEEPKLPAKAPRGLERLLSRCLRKDPEQRMHHMSDVRLALEDLLEGCEADISVITERKGRDWLWPAIAGMLILCAASGIYLNRQPLTEMRSTFRAAPITSYPGSEAEPSLSPDGNQVAFSWNGENRDNTDIYVRMISGGPPLRLTTDDARDHAPAWSPDGSKIAFLRTDGSGGTGESVMLISPLGGPELRIAHTASFHPDRSGLAWTPDGTSLAFADQTSPTDARFSIFVISLESSEKKQLTTPPEGHVGDLAFSISPDGQQLAFARHGTSNNAELYLLTLRPGEVPRRLATANQRIGGITWNPSGEEIIYSSEGGLWRCRAKTPLEAPVRLTHIEGPANDPVASRSGRLVYARTTSDHNIWGLNLNQTAAEPKQLVASPMRTVFLIFLRTPNWFSLPIDSGIPRFGSRTATGRILCS